MVSGMGTLAFSATATAIVIAVSVLALFLAVAIAWGSAAARESGDRLPKGSRKGHRAAH